MSKHTISAAALSVSVLALAAATPAFAQSETARAPAAGESTEILITAQKRTEKLQDVPVAASVVGATALAEQHVTDLSDINRVVPSVEIKGTFNGRVPYGMRGISTNANEGAIGLTSGVNIEIDGIPVPADSFAANTVSDVSQLEVLKGPQATLGGRTASAGTINFVTYSPTRVAKFGMDLTGTSDSEYRMSVHVSGPISDSLSYSLAGLDSRTPYPVYNNVQHFKSNGNALSLRGKLKVESGNFDALLTAHYALQTSHGDTYTMQYLTPGATVFPFVFAPAVPLAAAFPYPINYGNTTIGSPVNMTSRYQDADGSVALNYHLGTTTISSTTSYFHENQFQDQDIFLSNLYFWNASFSALDAFLGSPAGGSVPPQFQPHPPPFNNLQYGAGFTRQWTQEFKLATDVTKPVSALAGLYYSDQTVQSHGYDGWVGNPQGRLNIINTKSYAIYARVNARMSEHLSFIGGLRYNWDKLGWNDTELPINFATGDVYGTGAGAAPGDSGYLIMGPNCNPGTGCQWILHNSSGALVGDASVQYHPTRDTMVYASYTRGYKPVAYNTVHDWQSPQSNPAPSDVPFATPTKAEHIDSFELGLKTSAMDHHLTFDAAAFHTYYHGYQAQIFDTSKLIGILQLSNADARTQGVEVEANYRNGDTRINLSAAYIDAKFIHFAGAQCYPTQTTALGCISGSQNLSGSPLPDSPRFKLSASATQTVPMDGFNLVLGGNLSYRSKSVLQADQNPQAAQPGFALVDLNLGVQTKDRKLSLTFFVNNLTNHFYLTDAEDFFSGAFGVPTGPGANSPANAVVGQPARDARRYFGGRLSVNF